MPTKTNVYPSAQRRKMRGFEGFLRRAVVIVPTDEEFKARTAKREAEEGKDVPDSAILEMKANFVLPEKGDIFSDVVYTELQEEEAKAMIAQYNKEGNDHGYFSNFQQQKRFRMDDNRNDRRDFRSDARSDGGDQRRMDNRGRQDIRGGQDGWRDRSFNNNRRRGDSRGGWGPPRQGGWRDNRGGGGGGWRGGPPNRFNDRGGHGPRDMRDRNRDYRDRRDGSGSSSGGGGGGGGGGKMQDRRSDRGDDKNRPKSMQPQSHQQNWGNQGQSGYNQGWNQNYGNQQWSNWNQGYNQQQWKNYAQQPQQQAWGQQGWGNQGWSNTGWGQQYYNQYQQNWTQPQQAQGMSGTSDSSQATGTDSTSMAAAYASYGQATGAVQAGSWPGYTTVGNTGYASVGSTASSGGGSGVGTGSGNAGGSSMASYTTMPKQYRQDPRKAT